MILKRYDVYDEYEWYERCTVFKLRTYRRLRTSLDISFLCVNMQKFIIIALLLACWCVPAAGSTDIEVRISGDENNDMLFVVEAHAREAIDLLPGLFFDEVLDDNFLDIHIRQINKEELLHDDFCRPKDKTFGYYDRKRNLIVLSRQLVELAQKTPENDTDLLDCFHGTIPGMLTATLIHEAAHMYDAHHRISKRKTFRSLIGGPQRNRLFKKDNVRNYNRAGSPDPYEFTNAKEAFATNIEYYAMDSSYACARPAFSAFLNEVFDVEEITDCGAYTTVLLHSHIASDNLARMASVEPSRVHEVHYLHAAEGPQMASRWGHAMVRLVVCAPDRQEVGPACLKDSAHHLVLSYRANVADITINYRRGLMGAYPSQLFVYELPEIIKEYTRLEFRDLVSVPINYSRQELEYFINLTLERYWNYQGKYFFISNHCGTETLNQFRAVNHEKVRRVSSFTPRRLLRTLRRSEIVDKEILEKVSDKSTAGVYYFPSKKALYQAALDSVKLHGLFEGQSIDDFLKKYAAAGRAQIYQQFFLDVRYQNMLLDSRRSILMNLFFLERLTQLHEQKKLTEEIVKTLIRDKSGLIDSVKVELLHYFSEPWHLVQDDHYGVPERGAVEAYLSALPDHKERQINTSTLLRGYKPIAEIITQLEQLAEVEQLVKDELKKLAG